MSQTSNTFLVLAASLVTSYARYSSPVRFKTSCQALCGALTPQLSHEGCSLLLTGQLAQDVAGNNNVTPLLLLLLLLAPTQLNRRQVWTPPDLAVQHRQDACQSTGAAWSSPKRACCHCNSWPHNLPGAIDPCPSRSVVAAHRAPGSWPHQGSMWVCKAPCSLQPAPQLAHGD